MNKQRLDISRPRRKARHWRIQDFRLGAGRAPSARVSRRRRRQRRWGLGGDVPSQWGGVWTGGCAPSLENFLRFFCLGMVRFACILTHDYTVHNAQ